MPLRRRRRSRRARTRRPWTTAGIVVGLLALVLTAAAWMVVQRWQAGPGGSGGADGGAGAGFAGSLETATLYYVSEDGLGLVRHETPVAVAADPLERARAVVEQQLAPAPPPLISPFPEGTVLRAIYLANDSSIFVDLSGEVTSAHSGGSLHELFTVYALVNALVTNVPEIASVQIMVDGQEVDTLAGHIDLRQPLELSLAWLVEENEDEVEGEEDGDATPDTEEEDETEGDRADDDAGRTTDDRT